MSRLNFQMSLTQAINALGADENVVAEMLRYRNIRDEDHEEPINISKQNFQENFEISISESGAEIVVFDNLINLIPGFRYSARYEWPSIRDWMGKLEREYGVSILIVHHDNDKGDGAGTKDIRTQCGTILFLQDPRSKFVKGNWSKGTNSPFSDYIAKKGVLFKATIEKCSQYPNAVHSEFGAYFAYDAANPLSSSPWELIDVRGNQITDAQIAFASKGEDIKTLYPNRTEREYIALSLCLKNGKVKRKDLERALGKSRPTCNNTIKVLREDGLLDQRESGPATYYTLRRV